MSHTLTDHTDLILDGTKMAWHLDRVRALHEQDLAEGFGAVWLPDALAEKSRSASQAWGWQWVFPSKELSVDPRSGLRRRHGFGPGSRLTFGDHMS